MNTKDNANSAFYYELCILRLLADMGYFDQNALNKLAEIAAEDYGATLVPDKTLLCLNR